MKCKCCKKKRGCHQENFILDMVELGKAKAKIYGFKFNWFCSQECSDVFHNGARAVSAEEFAVLDVEKIRKGE